MASAPECASKQVACLGFRRPKASKVPKYFYFQTTTCLLDPCAMRQHLERSHTGASLAGGRTEKAETQSRAITQHSISTYYTVVFLLLCAVLSFHLWMKLFCFLLERHGFSTQIHPPYCSDGLQKQSCPDNRQKPN